MQGQKADWQLPAWVWEEWRGAANWAGASFQVKGKFWNETVMVVVQL